MPSHRRVPVFLRLPALAATLLLAAVGCAPAPGAEPESTAGQRRPVPAVAPGTSVTIMGAGDVAGDEVDASATAALIQAADPEAVFTTGDHAYPDGAPSDYAELYDPTWGRFKDRTYPVPGNHDYNTHDAAGYVDYFGAQNVTNSVDGGVYYAWDLGNGWRAYAVNTEINTSGAQLKWLQDDVAKHPAEHYILYGHRPRYTSGEHEPFKELCPLWDTLAATGNLEIVLGGHNHMYERFAPMDCTGNAGENGARSFVVGSGGKNLYDFRSAQPGSEFRNNTDFGVLELALYETSYEWQFIAAGRGEQGSGQIDTGNAGQILDKGSQPV